MPRINIFLQKDKKLRIQQKSGNVFGMIGRRGNIFRFAMSSIVSLHHSPKSSIFSEFGRTPGCNGGRYVEKYNSSNPSGNTP